MFFIADKPLKKRKQDTYPQESGAEANDGPTVQAGTTGSKLTPKKMSAPSNGASRPALMVSIDLQQAGRLIGQPVVVLDAQQFCEDHIQNLKSKTDGKVDKVVENRPRIIKQHADHTRKSGAHEQPETPKQKQESQRESKHRHDGNPDSSKGHSDDRRPDTPRQKKDRHSDSHQKVEKNHNSHRSHVSQTETSKTMSKAERNSRHGEDRDKEKDKNREKERNRDRDKEKDRDRHRDKARERERDKDRERERERDKDSERERDREKKKKTLSRENCNRHSPDGHNKSNSHRSKQDRISKPTDINGYQRTDSSTLQNPQNKKEKRNGHDSISCKVGNKQSFDTKPSEFPSYLLGGKSGSLKNFVIPKLKRDGRDKDPQLPKKLIGDWSEPLIRLERVSLIENLNKGAKPIVVLQKLKIDEVKRIIGESKNAHKSKKRSSFDQPAGGMIYFVL